MLVGAGGWVGESLSKNDDGDCDGFGLADVVVCGCVCAGSVAVAFGGSARRAAGATVAAVVLAGDVVAVGTG